MNTRTDVPTPPFVLILTLALLLPFGKPIWAQDCPPLANLRIEGTNLLSATVVPASGDLPEYCRVLGYVRPAINFEIRLPTAGWNGKFYMAGCGAYCGKLESDNAGFINAINYGLNWNYAVSTMGGGYWGETPG
jgi:feruloyl esterase